MQSSNLLFCWNFIADAERNHFPSETNLDFDMVADCCGEGISFHFPGRVDKPADVYEVLGLESPGEKTMAFFFQPWKHIFFKFRDGDGVNKTETRIPSETCSGVPDARDKSFEF